MIFTAISTATTLALLVVAPASAFTPNKTPSKAIDSVAKSSVSADQSSTHKPLFDPFGLYPKDAPERSEGRLSPLEASPTDKNAIKDPLGLYTDKSEIDDTPMSASLPFVKRPAMLPADGTLPGDRGFDPFNFSSDANALQWYQEAEVKHARLAMLAAVGWPLSELFDKKIAAAFDLKPLLDFHDRVPSVLNGGLDRTPATYWATVLGVAFAIESFGMIKSMNAAKAGAEFTTPGDLGFDPLGLAGKTTNERFYQAEAEIFNGRLAMLAVTGIALQEWWTQNSVINETPIFFKPINIVLEQLQDAAGNPVGL